MDRLPDVPMKATTVRMGENVHAQVAKAAAEEGVSVSAYLREAALARVWFTHGLELSGQAELGRALLAVARVAEEQDRSIEDVLRALLEREP